MKFGHAATISYAINSLEQMAGNTIVKGLNKDQARMVHGINESLGLYDNPTGNLNDPYPREMDKTQLAWVKDLLNGIFNEGKMPIWCAKWALEILEIV